MPIKLEPDNAKKRSSLEEKIDALVQWVTKYPKLRIVPIVSSDVLRAHAETDEEYMQLSEEYKTMQKYYEYIRARNSKGKLQDDQFLKCKEGNIGGVFGYSSQIELLASQYGRSPEEINHILSTYGTMDNFYSSFKHQDMKSADDLSLASSIIKNVMDIDFGANSPFYDRLFCTIFRKSDSETTLILYSSEKLEESLQSLTEQERLVLEKRFGLNGEPTRTLKSVAEELDVSTERVRMSEAKACAKLRRRASIFRYSLDDLINNNLITAAEKAELSELEKNLDTISLSSVQGLRDNPDVLKGCEFLKSIKEQIAERELEAKRIAEEGSKSTGVKPIPGSTLESESAEQPQQKRAAVTNNNNKQALVQRILTQQEIIHAQQTEIKRLDSQKKEL